MKINGQFVSFKEIVKWEHNERIMTEEQKEFENKYHYKVVRPLNHYNIPKKEYVVTSALLNWEDDGKTTVFAIKALDYSLENKHWFTIKIASDEFHKCINDFEIIEDGYEKYVKPVILDETLFTWEKFENDVWTIRYSSYMFQEKCGYLEIKKDSAPKDACIGMNEYMFLYKSIFDIGEPSKYIVRIPPNFEFRWQVEEWVKLFREDVLNNRVVYGINKRFMN